MVGDEGKLKKKKTEEGNSLTKQLFSLVENNSPRLFQIGCIIQKEINFCGNVSQQ